MSANIASAQNTSPLCFTARNGSVTVRFAFKNVTHAIQYSTNGTTWQNYITNKTVTIGANGSIYFRAAANQTVATAFGSATLSNCSRFYFTSSAGGTIEASGNIMSLYGPDCPDLPLQQYAFSQMFYQCGLLTAAPVLPSTSLADYCYCKMFYYCASLASAPALPADSMADYCYMNMFSGCASLDTAPDLPATTLADYCYQYMFSSCTSLTAAPALPADSLAPYCYNYMFSGCTSLAIAPNLAATTLADHCCYYMFNGCTALTVAPTLPADTLADYCYHYMFNGCSSLAVAPDLPATTLAPNCYGRMFSDCTSLTAAPALPADSLADWCYNNMFYDCISLTDRPTLPATKLAQNCYYYMFNGCTSLIAPPVLPATTLADNCYFRMFRGCSSMVVNVAPPGINWSIPAPTTAPGALTNMFSGTGGTMNSTPSVMTTYYIASGIVSATALANDSTKGSVSGSGLYLIGDTVTMIATPGPNYYFVGWSNGATTPVVSFVIDRDTTLTAFFVTLPVCLFEDSATICQGDTYIWRGRNLTTAGVYYDSLHTTVDCDSVYKLTLKVNPSYLIKDSHAICPGDVYKWHGRNLTVAGVYYDSLQTAVGCDSVYQLTLTVNPNYFIQETHAICQGNSYSWHGRNIAVAGVYYDSLHTTAGCDSIHQLTLTVNPTYFIQETHAICQGNTYTWHSRNLTTAGVYYDYLHTTAGCDSIHQLTLTVNPTYFIQENHAICPGDVYTWHGRNLTAAGVYYDSMQTAVGCDSVHQLTLTVNPNYFIQETHAICQGNSYSWHGRNLAVAGVYYDSLHTTAGCDSIHQLTLTVNPTYFIQETHAICQGNTYTWHSRRLTTAGVYYDYLHTTAGCDSVYELTLTVNPTYFIQETHAICPGDVYTWHGRNLTAAGVYYDSLQTAAGCDSVHQLTLTVNPNYFIQETHAICQGNSYSWHGRNLAVAGVYYDSLHTIAGCDSIHQLTLTVNPTYFIQETHAICQGNTYTWHSRNLTTAGVYYDYLHTTAGCDSVYELTLTVNPTYFIQENHAICPGDVYTWHGRNLTAAGVYYDSLQTAVGCDSVHQLTLTVIPQYFIQESHSICQGDVYTWHGRNLTVAGVYYDSLQAASGCDSIHQLTLTVNPTYFIQEVHSICLWDSYIWHGKTLTTTGVYYDSLHTVAGCDSVHQLTLTVNPTYLIQENHSICQGDTYTWHSRNLTVAGVYYDSLQTTLGCDSIHQLTLTVNPTYFIQENHAICQGNSYSWHNRNLTTTGIYYDSLHTTAGCDSIHQLTLTVNPTYFIPEIDTICQGDAYTWHGKSITTTGIYYDSLHTTAGCDSIHKLTLTVNPTYFIQETHAICPGDVYTWHGRNLTAAGVYYDSLQTAVGCDSVHQLTLTVIPQYFIQESHSICQGDVYTWHGRNLAVAGVYYDSLQTASGCDSIHQLTLTVNPTYFIEESHSICLWDSYIWHGKTLTTTGVYYDSLHTVAGCDSVHQLTLTVNPTYLIQENHSICQGDTYTWHGRNLTTSGVYYDSMQTTLGCDSIHQLTLTVNPTYFIQETHAICQGNSYSWHGRNLTTTGIYYDSLLTAAGCDSIHKLTLAVNPTYFIPEIDTICQGDAYTWHGKSLTTTGIYYDSLQTVAGCDSVHQLTLTVNPSYFIQETHSICPGDTYTWHGRNLTAAGVYYDSLQTTLGCDSIHQLTLTVNPTYFIQENHAICQGNSYSWHGRNLTTTGIYYDSLLTAAGCDSIHQLTLTVNPTYFIPEIDTICQGDAYTWHGKSITTTGIYYDSLQTVAGCDSVHQLTLTVNPTYLIQENHSICPGDTYTWHGRNLTAAGVYYDSLQTTLGCDSIHQLTLTVNPTYFIQENHAICQGNSYSWHGRNLTTTGIYYDSLLTAAGCDSIHKLTLAVNPTYFIPEIDTICQGDAYTWHGKSLTTTGIYYDSLQTVAGCDSIYRLTLTVNPSYLIQQTQIINQGDTFAWRGRNLTTTGIYYDSLQTTEGCDSIYELTLTVNLTYLFEDSVTICRGDVYPWHGQNITKAGIYYDSLTTIAGCDSVYKLTVTIRQYVVTINANDSTMGSVVGSGTYECGESVLITATAVDSCHSFVSWSDGNKNNPRTIVIRSDTSFTAIFQKNVYTITVSPNNARGGIAYCITDVGKDSVIKVECGETVEIHAETKDNYHFVGWSDGSTDSIRIITVTSDTDLVAIFKANCGDMTHWPVAFKFNDLLIVNLNALNAEGYDPRPDRISWYMVVGGVDAVEGTFPMDDKFVSTGYYMSLVANGLGGGKYYAVIDAVDIGTPCVGYMKSEIIEYIPGSQKIRMEVAPTSVRRGDLVTVSGLNADEVSIVRVYDYTGKLMQTIETSGTDQCQITTTGCAGVYVIKVTSDTANETFRFIVTK